MRRNKIRFIGGGQFQTVCRDKAFQHVAFYPQELRLSEFKAPRGKMNTFDIIDPNQSGLRFAWF